MEISITSITQYYNTGQSSTSGTESGTGAGSDRAANAAIAAATTAANNAEPGGGTPGSGGSSSTTEKIFGTTIGRKTTWVGEPRTTPLGTGGQYQGFCDWSASRTSTMKQIKMKFTIPTGFSAAIIKSATITFTGTSNNTTSQTYYICAPKSSTEQTNYQKYSDTTIIDTSKYASFSTPENTNAKTYTVTITDVLKQCVTKGQGWITFLIPSSTSYGDRYVTLSGTVSINVELSNTVRIVNGSSLDYYTVYVVENSALVPYLVNVVTSGALTPYS